MNFAKKCRELRMKKAATQEQMAAALNISSQAVSKWETGLTLPDITLLPEISVYFGVTIDELFDITDEKHLARIQNMVSLQETIDENDLEYAQNFLLSQLAQQRNEEYCLQLLPALYNKKAGEYRKKAEYYAKEALERFPENHNNHANLNEAQQGFVGDWNLDNQAEQLLYYKEFLERHPDSGEALRWYIEELIHVGRLTEAEAAIERLECLSERCCENAETTEDSRIELYRTKLLWECGKQEEALARMEALTKERSQEWLVWNSAGDMYARACRYEKAVACYEKCMEVQEAPRYTDAAMAIAQIGEITGDTALSAKAWNTYIRILKEDWGITEGVQVERATKKLRK